MGRSAKLQTMKSYPERFNVLGENISTITKRAEALLFADKEAGLGANYVDVLSTERRARTQHKCL